MKNQRVLFCLAGILLLITTTAHAQTNSWTNSASGYWQDAAWSLGILPGINQAILFTNAGIKTLTVDSNTVQIFPDTLSVDSITISAPGASSNRLVLSAGLDSRLIVKNDFAVDGNSAAEIDSSALEVGKLQVSGTFILDDGSLAAGSLNMGYFSDENPGAFVQSGGYHTNGGIDIGGTYVGAHAEPLLPQYELSGGILSTPFIALNVGGVLQSGGTDEVGTITIGSASQYILSGGWLLAQNVADIGPPDYGAADAAADFWQSGGTNQISGNLLIDNSSAAWITGGRFIAQSVSINNYSTFYGYGGAAEIQSVSVGGSGTYNLTDGTLSAGTETDSGKFNQQGGTNTANLTVSSSAEYDLFGGTFNGGIDLEGGDFNQWDGDVSAGIQFVQGNYHLAAGVLMTTALQVPAILPTGASSGAFLQTGGTHFADSVTVGSPPTGTGSYTLSNGVLAVSGALGINYYTYIQYYRLGFTADSYGSSFLQSGGICTNNGIYFNEPYNRGPHSDSSYTLEGGTLITPSINLDVDCIFNQSGGTNRVGNISAYGWQSTCWLTGGWLLAGSIHLSGNPGSFYQASGTNQVSENLSIDGGSSYTLAGGQLTIRAIQLSGAFQHAAGSLTIPGILTIANGSWYEQTGGQQFGPLLLGAGANSTMSLPTNSCVLKFSDSRSLTWSNAATLSIQNWSGSLYGGGSQQIIFGDNSAALTPQQLSEIQFQNPAGLPSTNYPARILATGEIVPDTGSPLPSKMAIACFPTNTAMQLTLGGDIGQSYDVEVSTDLVNWTWWTNEFNSNGTIYLNDLNATNYPQRFYRARPAP